MILGVSSLDGGGCLDFLDCIATGNDRARGTGRSRRPVRLKSADVLDMYIYLGIQQISQSLDLGSLPDTLLVQMPLAYRRFTPWWLLRKTTPAHS